MKENLLYFLNLESEEILFKMAESAIPNTKERDALNKGREFLDKLADLKNEESRQKVMIVLSAYLLKKLPENR